MSQPNYTVPIRIARPAAEIFQALVRPELLNRYFTDSCEGVFETGQTILWRWREWGDYPVTVRRLVVDKLVELEFDSRAWRKTQGPGYPIEVRLELESQGPDQTVLKISECGWPTDVDGLNGSHGNCSGWTNMGMCLKAFLEHGLDLR